MNDAVDRRESDERIDDTFAEAFNMRFTRLLVTADGRQWLERAAAAFCGYGTSVIGCDAECGIDQFVESSATPDGRPGVALLAFAFDRQRLQEAVINRAGQCLMTCPTTAVFDGLNDPGQAAAAGDPLPLGRQLRFFGDGFQKSKLLGERRFWRIPVMDGEFVVEEDVGIGRGVAGGNFILGAARSEIALGAAEEAVAAISAIPGCITPFPGGIARSGSKVGSRYQGQVASTSEAHCPGLRGRVDSRLREGVAAACEIVIDAVDLACVRQAMQSGIEAALNSAAGSELLQITAGNYGGKLGQHQLALRSL